MSTGLDVEAVLRDHVFNAQSYYQRTDQWTAHCLADACDWMARGEMGGRDAAEDAHRAHVAAVLRVEIESALADAWDEGWAARAQTRMPFLSAVHLDANPYRASLAATEGDRQ